MITYDELEKNIKQLIDRYKELVKSYDNLHTFSDSQNWISDVSALIRLFRNSIDDITKFKNNEIQLLENAIKARKEKSFFSKIIASKSDEKKHEEIILEMETIESGTESVIDLLNTLVEKTPISKEQQKEMLDSLKILKKELSLEKKTVNESIRLINAKARKNIASLTGLRRGTVGEIARIQRRQARLQKEIQLVPEEEKKRIINEKTLEIEKEILWVAHFKDDISPSKSVLRCAYCGRKVIEGEPCKSCGSIETMSS